MTNMVIINDTSCPDQDPVTHVDQMELQEEERILFLLSPQLWPYVLRLLPLSSILQVHSINKRIRELVESEITWAHIFERDFPLVRVKNDNDYVSWLTQYKKYYKQYHHPLSIRLTLSNTKVQFGDHLNVTIHFTNHSSLPLNLITSNSNNNNGSDNNNNFFNDINYVNVDEFSTGNVLRSKSWRKKANNNNINNNSNSENINNDRKRKEREGNSVDVILPIRMGEYSTHRSRVITIDKEYTLNLAARVELYKGQLGLRINEFLGSFLPLLDTQNKIWICFRSNGNYINIFDEFSPMADLQYWSGNVYSNRVTVYVKQADPSILPLRVNEYAKKCNALLNRRLSQY